MHQNSYNANINEIKKTNTIIKNNKTTKIEINKSQNYSLQTNIQKIKKKHNN